MDRWTDGQMDRWTDGNRDTTSLVELLVHLVTWWLRALKSRDWTQCHFHGNSLRRPLPCHMFHYHVASIHWKIRRSTGAWLGLLLFAVSPPTGLICCSLWCFSAHHSCKELSRSMCSCVCNSPLSHQGCFSLLYIYNIFLCLLVVWKGLQLVIRRHGAWSEGF